MREACLAAFDHKASTEDNPLHSHCPTGWESWCSYNHVLALGQPLPSQSPSIPPDYMQYLRPFWEQLCDERLLRKCLLGATQNRNESFNSLIWARAPKTKFTGLNAVRLVVSQAVLVFSSGCQAASLSVMESAGIQPGPNCFSYLAGADKTRDRRAEKVASDAAKQRRKSKSTEEKEAEEACVEDVRVTYEPAGLF